MTSDDHAGLKAAIARHFQGAIWQRGQVHCSRNLLGLVGASHRRDLAAELWQVFGATTRAQALAEAQQVAARWRATHLGVAVALEDDLEDCRVPSGRCLGFPLAHRPRLRTNGQEWLNQELSAECTIGDAWYASSQIQRRACAR